MSEEQIAAVCKEFFDHLDPEYAHLNNGSYGSTPKPVQDAFLRRSNEWRAKSDVVYYHGLKVNYLNSLRSVAPLVKCPKRIEEHLVLIDNATTGAGMVAQGIMWKFVSGEYSKGDVIVMFDCVYGAVAMTFEHYLLPLGAKIVKAPTPFPLNDLSVEEANEKILSALESTIRTIDAPIRMILLEHVPSAIGMLFPLVELAKVCRSLAPDAILYVDGAHAIGNVPIDLANFDVDFYGSNCHKWLFTPMPCAIFYSKVPISDLGKGPYIKLHNPIISWGYGFTFTDECIWTGTRDITNKFVLPEVLQFYPKVASKLGLVPSDDVDPFVAVEAVSQYNFQRVRKYAQMLADAWGTYVATPLELTTAMALIRLPEAFDYIDNMEKAVECRHLIGRKYKVVTVPLAFSCECKNGERIDKPFLRLSHHVYVSEDDIKRLKNGVLDIMKDSTSLECQLNRSSK